MNQPEVWLRGPVEGIDVLLQPVAHALLQAMEEINTMMAGFPEDKLWERPAGVASPGFHLKHIPGVLDRLFTYANGSVLSEEQMQYLASEPAVENIPLSTLLAKLNSGIERFIGELKNVKGSDLTGFRGVGRKNLPSTLGGLLFHCAEHSMRHTGQLLVTVKLIKSGIDKH